jgi:hypothetical protein
MKRPRRAEGAPHSAIRPSLGHCTASRSGARFIRGRAGTERGAPQVIRCDNGTDQPSFSGVAATRH